MDIILHNFIADMPGPNFLGFYALAIVTTLILCRILRHVADSSRWLPSPLIPKDPDPYELAYLRDGEREVARIAVFNLILRKFLEIVPNPANSSRQKVQQIAASIPYANQLGSMERTAFDWFAQPRTESEVASHKLPSLLKMFCADYQGHIQEEQLLTSSSMKSTAWLIGLLGILIIAGLGGYKLYVASMKGYSNVGFLIWMGIIALVILIPVCKPPRVSARGRKYLDQLQSAFGLLKEQVTKGTPENADITYLLTIGIFGTHILDETPYADYYRILHPVTTSSSGSSDGGGGGGGCGGGGGGGGGCGGCGH